ncbi:protein SOSEKI 2-like [Bidens hawaiensis]|uniref:protein SOSEKI 2-like n=1 Tax=Bidens hawaiensis TaxID=980011 RepID=UPI004049F739
MDEGRRVKVPSKSTTVVKPTFKTVQVVYYVSKNGELEHPHIVEVTHLVHHQLRLKDVLERLSVLRGRGMPSLYSWSCKRMYKSGYVWNDLAENDVILPSEGHEYVLKASQLVFHSPDKHLHADEVQTDVPKRKLTVSKRHTEFNVEELDYEEKRINYANTPSRCSKGIRILSPPSPPPSQSTTSGDSNSTSKRFEDGDPYPTLSRNSVLLHLMACGGSIGFKGNKSDNNNNINQAPNVAARKSCSSSGSLHKGVLCKKVAAAVAVEDEICCMSENPRFGKTQAEEREYFSGSIVEAMNEERVQVEPMLNKSSSYTEEREPKTMAEEEDDEMKREKAVAGKCIPSRFC